MIKNEQKNNSVITTINTEINAAATCCFAPLSWLIAEREKSLMQMDRF
jgi:hypothetical protein